MSKNITPPFSKKGGKKCNLRFWTLLVIGNLDLGFSH